MPIRILKFLTLFAVGGTERQFVYMTKNLDRSQFDVRIGCHSLRGEFLKDIEAMNLPVTAYPISSLYSPATLRTQWRFTQDLKAQDVRLVHAWGFYPNVFAVPAARMAGCVSIASVRDTGVFTEHARLKTLLQTWACRLADRIVVNSAAVRDSLIALGIDDRRIEIVPNGVIVPARQPGDRDFPIRRELGISSTAPVVAVVSRLNPGKGIEYFLRALARVSERIPDARYLIIGSSYFDPTYKSQLENLAVDLTLTDRVIFTGERHDIPELLREVDLSVLPSLSEGLSNSLLEAMAAELPVVATNVGGNPEIVLDQTTGLLVPPRDPMALGDAMIRILQSPQMARQFAKAGYERVKSKFSLEASVHKTENLYLSLLEERASRNGHPLAA